MDADRDPSLATDARAPQSSGRAMEPCLRVHQVHGPPVRRRARYPRRRSPLRRLRHGARPRRRTLPATVQGALPAPPLASARTRRFFRGRRVRGARRHLRAHPALAPPRLGARRGVGPLAVRARHAAPRHRVSVHVAGVVVPRGRRLGARAVRGRARRARALGRGEGRPWVRRGVQRRNGVRRAVRDGPDRARERAGPVPGARLAGGRRRWIRWRRQGHRRGVPPRQVQRPGAAARRRERPARRRRRGVRRRGHVRARPEGRRRPPQVDFARVGGRGVREDTAAVQGGGAGRRKGDRDGPGGGVEFGGREGNGDAAAVGRDDDGSGREPGA